MNSAKPEQPTVLRWDDVVELVLALTSRRRGASPFHSRRRQASRSSYRRVGGPECQPRFSYERGQAVTQLGVGRLGHRGTSAALGSGARAAVVIVGRWDRFLPRRVGDISMSIADFVRCTPRDSRRKEGQHDGTLPRGVRAGAEIRLRAVEGRSRANQILRRRIRSPAVSPERRGRTRVSFQGLGRQRLAILRR
jgi:hypothetical protein